MLENKFKKLPTIFIGLILIFAVKNEIKSSIFMIEGGSDLQYFYLSFEVGEQQSPQKAIIDTGSDTLAFPCASCRAEDCGTHADPRFLSSNSKSFEALVVCSNFDIFDGARFCKFNKSYLEGSSISGFLAQDFVSFKTKQSSEGTSLKRTGFSTLSDLKIKTEFGCTTKETGLFVSQYADGIMGLDDKSSFIQSVEKENKGMSYSFGFCFHFQGGIMLSDIRDKDNLEMTRFLDKNIEDYSSVSRVPYFIENGSYNVKIKRLVVGKEVIEMSDGKMMIDTGCSNSIFPQTILDQILSAINFYCETDKDSCGKLPNFKIHGQTCVELILPDPFFTSIEQLLATFPTIEFHFNEDKQVMRLTPRSYFNIDVINNKGCFSMMGDSGVNKITWGALNMVDNLVYFDRLSKNIVVLQQNCGNLLVSINRRRRVLSEVKTEQIPEISIGKLRFEVYCGILMLVFVLVFLSVKRVFDKIRVKVN